MISWFTAMINIAGWCSGIATQAYLCSEFSSYRLTKRGASRDLTNSLCVLGVLIVTIAAVNGSTWAATASESYAIYLGVIVLGFCSNIISNVT